jgi:hypothetical protein
MTEATKRNEKWLILVTAYFLDENDDYYEEALTFDPMGPLVLANHRDDIKAELKVGLIRVLAEHGYPPVDRDEVYKEIFEQAENFKRYQGAALS